MYNPLCCQDTCLRAARRAAADRCRFPGGAFSSTACRISSAAAGSGTGEIGPSLGFRAPSFPSGGAAALPADGCACVRPYLQLQIES